MPSGTRSTCSCCGILSLVFSPPELEVKDTEVSAQLGVSRTPVRETLIRLANEGFLNNQVGRGFTVCGLSLEEFSDLYPILQSLEITALRATPLPSKSRQERLIALNNEVGDKDQDPLRRLELDAEWHRLLVSECQNRTLLTMISQLRRKLHRYLHAYILVNPRIEGSINDHKLIVEHLAASDVESAVTQLGTHYSRSLKTLTETFTKRSET